MKFLVNCSNLKKGGGLQVADSICCELHKYSSHFFLIVLSSFMNETRKRIEANCPNSKIITYNIKNSFSTIVRGRDFFLDSLVEENEIDAVLTVFGPSRWNPKCPHLCGFARAHLVQSDSPYFLRMTRLGKIKEHIHNYLLKYYFERGGQYFWSENITVSESLKRLFPPNYHFYTVTNYYNQIFDKPELYASNNISSEYKGITCLSISTYKDYKNFEIIPEMILILHRKHPDFKVRFLLTLNESELIIPEEIKDCFLFLGQVDISYCPDLYQICDIVFVPTLLECFTASYPEAMKMEKPIVTTDLGFAKGLCGNAACYYKALDAESAAEALYKVAINRDFASNLVEKGKRQLLKYDNYEQRAEKLIRILETIIHN